MDGSMLRVLFALVAVFLSVSPPAVAQDRVTLGWGRLFSNDALGDGKDRWHTGSYSISRVRGTSWSGTMPDRPGEILEFRLRADTIAPASLTEPESGDRRYAGVLSFAMFTHSQVLGLETSLGAGLALTGPQTGIGAFQREIHQVLGLSRPTVLGEQIPNGVHAMVDAEVGRSFSVSSNIAVRPFVAAQAGYETLLRAGGDLVIGSFGQGALMLRDATTGQRYRGVAGATVPGLSMTLGADVARVFDSAVLPDGGAARLSDTRARVRAGMQWQGEAAQVFYGVTWLGREFDDQPEGQVVGSLNLRLRF